ncbi:ABC transporter ATP-binding protein [Cumulibacter soli]|uniref:ABC transporter ATP-binding protein n=1 Tax=Cumulibacter soli TaxID=2546344 RepID=UPI00106757FE|nr:ABC transporter ATP-binding protein [Cumulibacter soli]
MTGEALLEVDSLNVEFLLNTGWNRAVRDVSFSVARNEVFGLVGESGSGKSVTSMSLLGLLPAHTSRVQGSVRLGGTELLGMKPRELDRVRGDRVGMIFQEPMSSLNPAYTIGEQIAEVVRVHTDRNRKQAWDRAIEMIDRVGIPNARRNVEQYPHHFSGGMRQRAMIAMALACSPELLIADEPTTALDVTVQALILDLIKELQGESHMSVLLITHDLGVIAEIADRTAVMYAGEIVELDKTPKVFHEPLHPYTSGLLGSIISLDDDSQTVATIPGQVPSIKTEIHGCRFAERCSYVEEACRTSEGIELAKVHGRDVRCRRASELQLEGL